jgi:xanthosine utilization system XapX-like protein
LDGWTGEARIAWDSSLCKKQLALLPFLGILVGVPLLNRVTPLVLGLPLVLAWLLLWIVLTSAIMAVIYVTDPVNRSPDS